MLNTLTCTDGKAFTVQAPQANLLLLYSIVFYSLRRANHRIHKIMTDCAGSHLNWPL